MLSPQLRKKVHNLWSLFWSAGMTNPLVAIEQITYLLFLRQLESLDAERVKQGKTSIYYVRRETKNKKIQRDTFNELTDYNQCRWSYIRQNPSFQLLNETVFPWLRGLEKWLASQPTNGSDHLRAVTGRLDDAYFTLDPNKTETLTRAVAVIDELFRQLDTRSVNSDIMGDIFEHLLDEIQSSGKNGQFRTPRHVTRFMVELLEPALGSRILDPACGTGGFLINTLLHWRAKNTDSDVLKLEWDGTPQGITPVWPKGAKLDFNGCIHGYDNDRTMVRIAWMNLILHDLEFPSISQLDSLSKRLPDSESAVYDHILANPPFTGSVDEGDLSTNRQRFPVGKGKKPITTKSELLFVWLILDLLRLGGRAAVVVPDGVLFSSTNMAHLDLRRQLLFENTLEAVISVPADMFQPYSGVKTSILVFQRAQSADSKPAVGDPPRTKEVWFYEIEDEAYSLDQKRKPRTGRDNDLWDALAKFSAWKRYLDGQAEGKSEKQLAALRHVATSTDYWQPEYWEERWRAVDDDCLKIFPEKSADKGHTYGIHELWPDLPRDPAKADDSVAKAQQPLLEKIFSTFCREMGSSALAVRAEARDPKKVESPEVATEKAFRELVNKINRLIRDESLLDREFDQFGYNALRSVLDDLKAKLKEWSWAGAMSPRGNPPARPNVDALADDLRKILREFARLDGYNLWRRELKCDERKGNLRITEDGKEKPVPSRLSWVIPVRAWAKRESWGIDAKTQKEISKPTHKKDGEVRDDYVAWLRDTLQIFESDGSVKEEFLDWLDPDCIEALDLNLSAARHKPFTFDPGQHQPPAKLIAELRDVHSDIQHRLGKLLKLTEGK